MNDDSKSHPMLKDFRMLRHRLSTCVLVAVALSALSCSDSTSPTPGDTRDANDLRLLSAPYGTPPLARTQVSFYAVQGKAGGADIWYHAKPGATDSLKFLAFRVGSGSLATRPDGSTIVPGDSVLITITVTDQTHFIVDFQPSGLRFSASDQPTLTLSFAACGEDLNYDGVVNSYDQTIMASLSFWRQESPFQPWSKVMSTVQQNVKQVNASLGGFTGYALEY